LLPKAEGAPNDEDWPKAEGAPKAVKPNAEVEEGGLIAGMEDPKAEVWPKADKEEEEV
jgi:hypothetical protein